MPRDFEHENLMRAAKMVRDEGIAMGLTEIANASVEEIAEVLKNDVYPERGIRPKDTEVIPEQ